MWTAWVGGKIGAVATLTATVKDGPLEVFSTFVRSRQKREGLRLMAPVCRKDTSASRLPISLIVDVDKANELNWDAVVRAKSTVHMQFSVRQYNVVVLRLLY